MHAVQSSLLQAPRVGSGRRLSAAACEKFLYKIKMRFSKVFLKCPVSASIESRLKSTRRFSRERAGNDPGG